MNAESVHTNINVSIVITRKGTLGPGGLGVEGDAYLKGYTS